MSFTIYSSKTGKYLNQVFCIGRWPLIVWMKYYLSNFDITLLTCDLTLFPGKNIPKIAKPNRVLCVYVYIYVCVYVYIYKYWDKDFILKYLDSSMAEVFSHYCLFLSILAILRRKRWVKVGPKVVTLGPSLFHKY